MSKFQTCDKCRYFIHYEHYVDALEHSLLIEYDGICINDRENIDGKNNDETCKNWEGFDE